LLDIGLGLADSTSVERAVKIALAIVLLDFTGYAAHVLMHKVGALWRLHVVHHSDVMVDVTTGLRQHPFEAVIRFAFTAVPVMALGIPPESAALYRLLSGANAFLEHANMTLPRWLEPTVRAVFVTPAMHKVHHSRFQPETDSNYGNIFSIFDRLARTYRSPVATRQPADAIDYGLDSFPATPGSGFVRLLALR
jgi:sterol desaturase/sphingolipid hydroxylase (fatty acid hydroxylase superfamily)